MQSLVEDLLLLARLDEGRPLAHDAVDLTAVVDEAVAAVGTLDGDHRVIVDTEPVEIVGDGQALRQILDNLLINVVVHTPPGTTATVTLEPEPDGNGEVRGARLVVSDDGPGMAPDIAAHVFERFVRAERSRARPDGSLGGSGLGLSIVDELVRAHGGTITLDTAPGAGATFTVTLSSGPRRRWAERPGPAPSWAERCQAMTRSWLAVPAAAAPGRTNVLSLPTMPARSAAGRCDAVSSGPRLRRRRQPLLGRPQPRNRRHHRPTTSDTRNVVAVAKAHGLGGVTVVDLFSWRVQPSPSDLERCGDRPRHRRRSYQRGHRRHQPGAHRSCWPPGVPMARRSLRSRPSRSTSSRSSPVRDAGAAVVRPLKAGSVQSVVRQCL